MYLTDRTQATSVNPTDFIHIVNTASTLTNAAGDSFKAQISQIFELTAGCCLTGATFSAGTLSFINSSGTTAFQVSGLSFTGGSGSCINDFYVNNIYPCATNINIQPQSTGKVFFGAVSGASGFTVDLVTQTNATRLGLNTNSPQYTFDFYSYNRASRLYFDDSSNPNLYQIVLSGGSNTLVGHTAYSSGSYGLQFGIRGTTNTTYDAVGAAGDAFIFANTLSNGINIVTKDGGSNLDYVRFYLGTTVSGASYQPHIHINGSGTTKGFIGIGQGNTTPTSLVDISGSTGYSQLRLRNSYTPSGTTDTNGNTGQINWDTSYFYVRTISGWKRASITTW